jgi:hypothetical protein
VLKKHILSQVEEVVVPASSIGSQAGDIPCLCRRAMDQID